MKAVGPVLMLLAMCIGAVLFAVLIIMVVLPVLLELADAAQRTRPN